jgi:hypothetical protein
MSAVDAKGAEQNPGANAGVLLPTRGTTMMSLAQCFDTALVLGRLARGIADALAVHRADLIGQHRALPTSTDSRAFVSNLHGVFCFPSLASLQMCARRFGRMGLAILILWLRRDERHSSLLRGISTLARRTEANEIRCCCLPVPSSIDSRIIPGPEPSGYFDRHRTVRQAVG